MAETSELNRRIAEAQAARETIRNTPAPVRVPVQETDADRCTVCGNFADSHTQYKHAFTLVQNDLREKPAPTPPKRQMPSVLSTDIALRLALIDKGVLTADDIFAAETKLGLHPFMAELGQPAETPAVPDHVD